MKTQELREFADAYSSFRFILLFSPCREKDCICNVFFQLSEGPVHVFLSEDMEGKNPED